ncbi:hypothetical protein ACFRAQ_34845 [Nocardia sp. NPDC056611]|uniref:hypothetical protein n=1 Tax=Nocardia sp. NPDC056611 TaxID=3345877 RepID=UPI003670776F
MQVRVRYSGGAQLTLVFRRPAWWWFVSSWSGWRVVTDEYAMLTGGRDEWRQHLADSYLMVTDFELGRWLSKLDNDHRNPIVV